MTLQGETAEIGLVQKGDTGRGSFWAETAADSG